MKPRIHKDGGFTFIEVMIALSLLAISSGILIKLEGSAIESTMRDRGAQQAMLAARRIMSMVEATEKNLSISSQTDVPILTLFSQMNIPEPTSNEERQALDQLRATIQIQDWNLPIPNLTGGAIQKLTLAISWSNNPQDVFVVTYFPPAQDGDEEDG